MSISTEPAIGVSFSVQIDDKRSLVFQTHFPQATSAKGMNELVDRTASVADRMEKKYRLELLRKQRAQHLEMLDRSRQDMNRLDREAAEKWALSGKKGDVKLSGQDANHRGNAVITQKRIEEEIVKIDGEIEECWAAVR